MLWPFWIEAVSHIALSPQLVAPWLLVVVGLSAQAFGVWLMVLPPALNQTTDERAEAHHTAVEARARAVQFLIPIAGGEVPSDPDLLPGAPRRYRGGEHEGVDFACGPGTSVRATAAGYVLSIDDEPDLPRQRREELLRYCRSHGETPGEVLEALHGRRVVLCHGIENGELITSGYSHLERVEPSLRPGSEVKAGQVIGWAGNSGTSHAYGDRAWAELHFELRRSGKPVGLGLPAAEAAAQYRDFLKEEKE